MNSNSVVPADANSDAEFIDNNPEDIDDLDEDADSEVAGQCENKRCLDRFSFLTCAQVCPVGLRKYEVSGDAGLPFLYCRVLFNPTGCCVRNAKPKGSFIVDIADISSRQTVVKLICDKPNLVIVESPPTEIIGYVDVERIMCSLRFLIRDSHGVARLLVCMPKYCNAKCRRHSFRVQLPDESDEVAYISRRLIYQLDDDSRGPVYTLRVSEMMGTNIKAMLIGVMLLFDTKLFVETT